MIRDTFFRRKESVVKIEGLEIEVDLSVDGRDLHPGDLYVAERNTGPQLLTCKKVVRAGDLPDSPYGGWVMAEGNAYSYDLHECRKVVKVDGEPVQ